MLRHSRAVAERNAARPVFAPCASQWGVERQAAQPQNQGMAVGTDGRA
jgi:hypothetical protein